MVSIVSISNKGKKSARSFKMPTVLLANRKAGEKGEKAIHPAYFRGPKELMMTHRRPGGQQVRVADGSWKLQIQAGRSHSWPSAPHFEGFVDWTEPSYFEGEKTKTVCGTSEYMAPEIIKKEAYGLSVDWWSYGVLVYELLVGKSPFNDADESQVLALALSARVSYPVFISKPAKDFIGRLLNKSPTRRLGAPEIKAVDPVAGHVGFGSHQKLGWGDTNG
eukprot:s1296_g21.t1